MNASGTVLHATILGQIIFPAVAMIVGTIAGGSLIYVVRRMHQLFGEIEEIKHEVKPNGGTSMKDTVNRIDTRAQLIGQRLDDHVKSSDARIERLEGKRRWL